MYIGSEKEVWAYACQLLKTNKGSMHLLPPTKGVVTDFYFIPYNKDGTKSSQAVSKHLREYADTYEEAKEKFNAKCDGLIKYYKEQINRIESKKCS